MKEFKVVKRSIWLPLVTALLLCGCFFFDDDVIEKGSYTDFVGFTSDTTAILFRYNWEEIEKYLCAFEHRCVSTDYIDIELKLVDVRFDKVYWKSKVKNNYGKHFWTKQWNDSTIIIEYGNQGGGNYMLWAIDKSKPEKITLIWNTEKKDIFSYNYNWFRWKDDSIIAGDFIIDTKTKTVNSQNPAFTEEELLRKGAVWDGEKFIYLENECKSENMSCYASYNSNLCKCPETLEPCKAFVISSNGDTLHTVGHYPYIERQESFGDREIDKRCEFRFSFSGNLISIRAINRSRDGYYEFTLPSALLPKYVGNVPNTYGLSAMVFIDKNKKELRNPLFWYNDVTTFVDSIGNIMEYWY